jgi:phosphoglycerate dehydrogenase-like enzyme
MFQCVILDDYQNVARSFADWASLDGKVALRVLTEHIADRDALAAELADAAIVVAMRERTAFDAALLARLPKLRLLVTTGMVNASIDMKTAAARGITVCGAPGSAGGSTGDLTFGLILSLMRHIPREVANLRHGGSWQLTVGRELHGKQLSILGLGNLGRRVARIAKAFGMQVSAWSQNLTRERCETEGVVFAGSLDALIAQADILTIHLLLSERSRGLIGPRELRLMKPDAILVNTSRGPIVEEAALIDALRDRRIAAAGLDVYDREPLPVDHPFRTLDNVLATPHLGYVTEEAYRGYFGHAVEDIRAYLEGEPIRVLNG